MVSIIVPVYNVELYLDECVRSIVAQDYTQFECWLIDDGSQDRSGYMCDEWARKDNRIQVVHKQNEGVSVARNVGIRRSSGEYITFVDSDDMVKPTYLSDMMDCVKDNADLYVSGFELYPIPSPNTSAVPQCHYTFEIDEMNLSRFIQLNEKSLLYGPCVKLYKTSIIKKNGVRFDPSLSLGEDLHFNYEYLKHVKRITTIPKVNYYYRQVGASSLSKKYRDDLFEVSYEQWHFMKDFYISRNLWNDISRKYMAYLMWAFVYDGIFEFPKRRVATYDYLWRILSIEEILELKMFPKQYKCAAWIKYAIIHRWAWLFYIYFVTKRWRI